MNSAMRLKKEQIILLSKSAPRLPTNSALENKTKIWVPQLKKTKKMNYSNKIKRRFSPRMEP